MKGFVPAGFVSEQPVDLPQSQRKQVFVTVKEDITTSAQDTIDDNDDEYDPLEAFMVDIKNQSQKEATKPPREQLARCEEFEEEDEVESYINAMKRKGINVGTGEVLPIGEVDEVYSDFLCTNIFIHKTS